MARKRDELATYMKDVLKLDSDKVDEVMGDVDGLVTVEVEVGKKAKRTVNKEAEKLRTTIKGLEPFKALVTDKLGYDADEDDLEDFAEALTGRLVPADDDDDDAGGKKKKKKGTPPALDSEMAKRVKALEKSAKADREGREVAEKTTLELQTKQRRSVMTVKLTKALTGDDGKPKLYGHDLVVRSLIDDKKVGLKDDGETVVFIKGQGDDAEEVSFDDGIKEVMNSRKDLQVNSQNAGAGSKGGEGGGGGDPAQQTDSERVKKLRDSQGFAPLFGDETKKA